MTMVTQKVRCGHCPYYYEYPMGYEGERRRAERMVAQHERRKHHGEDS